MFKKITLALIALALVASLASCAKYGDLKDSMDKMGKTVEKFVADGTKATATAQEAVAKNTELQAAQAALAAAKTAKDKSAATATIAEKTAAAKAAEDKAESTKAADAKAAAAAVSAYADEIKANSGTLTSVFNKYTDDLGNPATDYPADVKASHEKFVKFGEQLAPVFSKITASFGTDTAVLAAYTKHYEVLKKSIGTLTEMADKFVTDMGAAKDGKTAGGIITGFSASFRKDQEAFNLLRPLYPELSFLEHLPDTLMVASADYGRLNTKVVDGMAKAEAFATDADLKKALDGRYATLKTAVDSMLKGTEAFIAAMDKATDAKTTATAIEGFALAMRSSQKVVASEVRLFPELQSKGIEGLPVSIGEPLKKMGTLNDKVREAVTKSDKYKDDEAVKKALAKLNGQG